MNILIAPNSMKGSLNAREFADTAAKAFRSVSPLFNVRTAPVADGGDYTGEILIEALGAGRYSAEVNDPLKRPVTCCFGVYGDMAVIEMASASGLKLLSGSERNPETASSFGTGQLIKRAIELGCKRILLGAGGSATVDGGIGILDALGFEFLDCNGKQLPGLASSLPDVTEIRGPLPELPDIEIDVLCDVNNPLLGKDGAASVFGPQKGAGPEMVLRLERGLENWASVVEKITGSELRSLPGTGAAGGIACGLSLLKNTKLLKGSEFVFEMIGLEEKLKWADLVLTGEGRLDSQSLSDKAPYALSVKARQAGVPVIALAGSYEDSVAGSFDAVFSILNEPVTTGYAMQNAGALVFQTSLQIARFLLTTRPDLAAGNEILKEIQTAMRENQVIKAMELLGKLNSDSAAYWYYKGMALKKQQKWGDAMNAFLNALDLDASFDQARAGLEMTRSILSFTNPHLLDP
jgi:glycerate kinase